MADNLPATIKVLRKVKELCEAAAPTVTWIIERSDEDALSGDELDGVVIALRDTSIADTPEMGGGLSWLSTLIFDSQAQAVTGQSIELVNQETMATIMATIHGSDLLGGMVDEIEPRQTDPSEQSIPDVGWAVLQYQVRWITPYGDTRKIIGRNGQIF